ncbi:MAG TPA: SAM-dependent methyltransferase [Aigarchaeota archaeon]|nr:SAM-dependent methyltransferase [Aigarchaeota archaeon]
MVLHPRLLTCYEARRALQSRESGDRFVELSLDLGVSREVCRIVDEGLLVGDVVVEWRYLGEIAEDSRGVYVIEDKPRRLCFFADGHFYALAVSGEGHAPTVEVDGIHMHRVKDIYPEEDALQKVRLLGQLRCKKVLDICTGLGYTSIQARRLGACKVVTIEKDRNILALARINPWSRILFEDPSIEVVEADAVEYVEELDVVFDAILHDPPTIKIAGELYSGGFYKSLYRVLKRKGTLVHYVGRPGRGMGAKIYVGVMRRLRAVGFAVSFDRDTECVVAVKV